MHSCEGGVVDVHRNTLGLSHLQEAVDAYAAYKDVERQLADAKELLRESDGGYTCAVFFS